MSSRATSKLLLISLCIAAVMNLKSPKAHAVDLDLEEAIDAELDTSLGHQPPKKAQAEKPTEKAQSSEAKPQAAPQAAPQMPEPQMDLGDSEETPPHVTETLPKENIVNAPAKHGPEKDAPSEPVQSTAEPRGDVPDNAMERRFHSYAKSYKPIDEKKWQDIVGERRQENYNVQTGDTLWDISSTFFGDGFYWGKLWSQNPNIENPHRIVKSKGIRFIAGTEADAPLVAVADQVPGSDQVHITVNTIKETYNEQPVYREQAEKEISKDELESGNVIELDELVSSPEIPPPTRAPRPTNDLPPSFAEKKTAADGYDKTGISFSGSAMTKALVTPAKILAPSFMMDDVPSPDGKIDEIELGEQYASIGQTVYVRMNHRVALGDRFTVVTPKDKLGKGRVVEVGGVVVLSGFVDENKNVYRANVIANINPVEKGAMLISDPPPIADFDASAAPKEIEVTVLGGEFDQDRKVLGDGAIIYLSGGKGAGLSKGDVLGVEETRSTRRAESRYGKVVHPIAKIHVIDVRERVATALITRAYSPVSTGDKTGLALPKAEDAMIQESVDEISHSRFGSQSE